MKGIIDIEVKSTKDKQHATITGTYPDKPVTVHIGIYPEDNNGIGGVSRTMTLPTLAAALDNLSQHGYNVAPARLRLLREDAGMTQKQLAEKIEADSRYVQKLESGEVDIRNITITKALLLAVALGVAVEDLI